MVFYFSVHVDCVHILTCKGLFVYVSSMLAPAEVDVDWMSSFALQAFYIEAELLIWTQNSDSACLSSQLPFWILCLVLQALKL